MIEKLNEVNAVQVVTYPGKKDTFKEPLHQEVILPGTFFMGAAWHLHFACKQCGSDVQVKNGEWHFMSHVSWDEIPDVQLLDHLGKLFELGLSTDFNESGQGKYRLYLLTGIYKGMARVAYYQCAQCESQYLMVFYNVYGDDDRHPEPDLVYVEKILRVRFDHNLFMKLVKK